MRKQLITLLFLICGLISKAQQKSETYYKDYYLTKEVNKKKAKFKKIETKNTNELINIQIFNLSNNCLVKEENYKGNNPTGIWITYSENCSIETKRDFSKLIYSKKQIDTLFNNVIEDSNPDNYEKAQYGDNENAIFQYIKSQLKYPSEAIDAGISGMVILQFIINPDGSIKMVSIVQSAHAFLDYESWELIENMPKWNPAKKNGQAIASYYNVPITFRLK
ncbi:MAG: energy transducer TonB [Bacteroidales bacterium]|nr:energy transducer TonB [Bacteroidales bacterium]NLK81632.1 energy transducer TonB [Bacteroidales bacterium]